MIAISHRLRTVEAVQTRLAAAVFRVIAGGKGILDPRSWTGDQT
jgi:hypothetical protein